jgi:hypothetical protein
MALGAWAVAVGLVAAVVLRCARFLRRPTATDGAGPEPSYRDPVPPDSSGKWPDCSPISKISAAGPTINGSGSVATSNALPG